jgi:hypothetical protein
VALNEGIRRQESGDGPLGTAPNKAGNLVLSAGISGEGSGSLTTICGGMTAAPVSFADWKVAVCRREHNCPDIFQGRCRQASLRRKRWHLIALLWRLIIEWMTGADGRNVAIARIAAKSIAAACISSRTEMVCSR